MIPRPQDWNSVKAIRNFLELYNPHRTPHGILIIELKEIARCDPVLHELLVKEPENVLKGFINIANELPLYEDRPIHNINLVAHDAFPVTALSEIGSHYQKLVKIVGHINSISEDKIITTYLQSCHQEKCPAKGRVIRRKKKMESCPVASCRMYYDTENTSEERSQFRECVLEETTISEEEIISRNITLRVILPKETRANILHDQYLRGDKVDCLGVVKKYIVAKDREGNTISNYFLELVGISFDTTNELSPEDIQRGREWLDKHKGERIEALADQCFSGIYKLKNERMAFIISAIGLQDDKELLKGKSTQFGIAIIGDPATGKTSMAYQIVHYFPKTNFVGAMSSTAGIVGGLEKRPDGSWQYAPGKLVKTNHGVFIADEVNVMGEEVLECFVEVLSHNIVRTSKIHQKSQRIHCNQIFLANPPDKSFSDYEPLIKQHNIPETLLDRCDFVIFLRQNLKESELSEYARFVGGRASNPKDTDDNTLKAAIKVILNLPNPTAISDEAHECAERYWKALKAAETRAKEVNARGFRNYSGRSLVNIIKIACAIARVEEETTVQAQHVEQAYEVYYNSSVEPMIKEYGGIEVIDLQPTKKDAEPRGEAGTIRWLVNELDKEPNGELEIEEICERAKSFLTPYGVDELIVRAKKSGDIFEPRRGLIKKI